MEDNFRKKARGQAPDKYQDLLNGSFQLVDSEKVSVADRTQYLRNKEQYQKRLARELDEYNSSLAKIKKRHKDYNSALSLIASGTESDYINAVPLLEGVGPYRDAMEKLAFCRKKIAEFKARRDEKNRIAECWKCYNYAVSLMKGNTETQYKKAIDEFRKIPGFEDSDVKIKECEVQLQRLKEENAYQIAKLNMERRAYVSAAEQFKNLGDYKDSRKLGKLCVKYSKGGGGSGGKVFVICLILLVIGVGAFFVFGDTLFGDNSVVSPSSKTGTLVVSSTPTGASVYINDVYKGYTPLEIQNLAPGTYTISISKGGSIDKYIDIVDKVTISAGKEIKKEYTLSEEGGSLDLITKPEGAHVYLDGVYKGVSPILINGLSDGQHTIRLTLSGYPDQTYTFTTKNGNAGSVALAM